jgi:hypothetical protein
MTMTVSSRAVAVKDRSDSSLCDGDSLLLHSLVDSDSIFITHLVKLINTDNTAVSEYHGNAFKMELALKIKNS